MVNFFGLRLTAFVRKIKPLIMVIGQAIFPAPGQGSDVTSDLSTA